MLLDFIKVLTTKYYLKGFYRILWATRIFLKTRDNVYSLYGTVRMKLNHNHYYQWMMACTDYYAFGIKKLLNDFLRPGDVFVDVGANIGYLSLIASSIVSKDGMVVAFEPDPRALICFRNNIALNDIDNIILIEKMCSNEEGKAKFSLASHLGWSTATRNITSLDIVGEIEAKQCTLDNVFAGDLLNENTIRLIKIDAEGYEPYILEGAKAIIERNETAFIIEINHERLIGDNRSIEDILKLFRDKNYCFYWINEKRGFINSLKEVEFERIVNLNNYYGRNGDIFVAPLHFMT